MVKRALALGCLILFFGLFILAAHAAAGDRFVDNKNGTVTDTQTGLMWAKRDNGRDVNWWNGKSYCEGFSGGGKTGWRMPTMSELEQLYSYWRSNWNIITIKGDALWAGDGQDGYGGSGSAYHFDGDGRRRYPFSLNFGVRALPVRNTR